MARQIPRKLDEAIGKGFTPHKKFSFMKLSESHKARWIDLSISDAKPGDIAKIGPWVGNRRTVCYYDENLDPTNCVTETRAAVGPASKKS